METKTVTVIGAGIWGSWTAYFLQSNGFEVTLVDRWGGGNSNSGSGGETRIIRTVYGGDEVYTQMAHRSFQLWHKYLDKWQAPLYHKAGSLWLSDKSHKYVTKSALPMNKLGYDLIELSVEEARQKYPQIDFNKVESVHYEPDCGYIEARNACRKVAEEFEKIGGNYIIDQVTNVKGKQKIASITTINNGEIESDLYVFACGPWITKLFPILSKYIHSSRQEVYFFQDELLKLDTPLPMWLEFQDDGDMYYGIPDHFNRGFKISYDSRDISFDPDHDDRTITPDLLEKIRRYMGKRFPGLKDSTLVEARVCVYENSIDGDYIIDHLPSLDNGLILGGTSGHGFKMAPAIGEIVLGYVTEKRKLPDRFRLERFGEIKLRKTQFS